MYNSLSKIISFIFFSFIFLTCYVSCGLNSEPKSENNTNTLLIPSESNNVSLTAKDNGILITIIKDENQNYKNIGIVNTETKLSSNTINNKWNGNKMEIFYPFSKSGKISTFDIYFEEKQTVSIIAKGGIGYPIIEEKLESIKQTPNYDLENDSFSVTIETDVKKIQDFFIEDVNKNDKYIYKEVGIQFWLGNPEMEYKYGFGGISLGKPDGLSGTYINDFNWELPPYSNYKNKFCTQANFNLLYEDYHWWGYAKSISTSCNISVE